MAARLLVSQYDCKVIGFHGYCINGEKGFRIQQGKVPQSTLRLNYFSQIFLKMLLQGFKHLEFKNFYFDHFCLYSCCSYKGVNFQRSYTIILPFFRQNYLPSLVLFNFLPSFVALHIDKKLLLYLHPNHR